MSLPLYFWQKSYIKKQIGKITFIDILVHLDIETSRKNRFKSNYWTFLIKKIHDLQLKTNWLHQFNPNPQVKSLWQANNFVNNFTLASSNTEIHNLLNKPLTIKMLIALLNDFLKIRKSYKKLESIYDLQPIGYHIDFWPFHIDEWKNSILGIPFIATCLKLYFFNKSFSEMPKQSLGIYISENQPWEMALIYSWRLCGHQKLVGVPHSTIRYWDLRYHYYFSGYSSKRTTRLPLPDFLAVNGNEAYKSMLKSGYPSKLLFKVEALRYLHLLKRNSDRKIRLKKPIKILLCGDYISENNDLMLNWINFASKFLSDRIIFIFKPHPAYDYKFKGSLSIKIKICHKKIEHLLPDCDIVVSGNITSASVDAYCYGIPVIQVWDKSNLNLSPLRGCLDVTFVSNHYEMLKALRNTKLPYNKRQEYFFLDKSLNRWKSLLHNE